MGDFLIKLIISSVCGAAIGFQRELKDRPAGLRTHTLVALASCLFTVISLSGIKGGDPTRIVSNVAVGIGFIGAGTIIKQGNIIIGLTTAASLWTVAAVGVLVGAGFYFEAFLATAVSLLILVFFKEIEERVGKKRVFEFKVRLHSEKAFEQYFQLQKKLKIEVLEVIIENGTTFIKGSLRFKTDDEVKEFINKISSLGELEYQKWV